MIICMATVEAQIYYHRHASIRQNVDGVTALIIVQTIIHHHRKVFTTGQARVNPECYVIKCVGSQ